ncbi:unnamed protein product [Debaryomyces tyrocola]|nr:unnamed protein product [Debaryomyces tyrocola]
MNYLNYNRYEQKREQNANTNLDQDLTNSRHQKYTKSEPEVKQWIFSVLSTPQLTIDEYSSRSLDLIDILKDGELLCKLGKFLEIPNNPCSKYKSSKMPFVQMENISFFLKTCEIIGISHDEIFQTIDLYERKDPYQIIITLISFSRRANEINPTKFPNVIGPKIVKIKPTVPKKPINLSTK